MGIGFVAACTSQESADSQTGLRLMIESTDMSWTAVDDVQEQLRQIGIGVWPLDLRDVPADIRGLLAEENLTDEETARARDHFLLSRERLLELVAESGRTPNVPGGGAMETNVANQAYGYPQLWVVQGDVDYTRFDVLHVNTSDDGVGVDEVLQMVSGGGVVVRNRRPDGRIYNLRLDCLSADACWMFSYDAGEDHVGSLSSATPGTKLVVQAFGP
ncbi:MAG: hypothetical protein GWN29_10305, partial [Gammaproteobacteria bacterium]|nr:hypothetical protein [Gammaproteobacteria bacterium]